MAREHIFSFVGNGPYLNRGCEAIVRGTVEILRKAFGQSRFINMNFDSSRPLYQPMETDPDISNKPVPIMKRNSPQWFVGHLLRRTIPSLSAKWHFGMIRDSIKKSNAVLSIGGDNYTLDYGIPRMYLELDRYVRKYRKPLIIWGASLGPFERMPELAAMIHNHLRDEVTAIFVRELRSRSYLEKHGIAKNVHLMADPAFLMNSEPVTDLTLGFALPTAAIGLNFSPLLGKYLPNPSQQVSIDTCIELLTTLRKAYGRPIVLLPHVTSPHDNDFELINRVYEKLGNRTDGVFVVPGHLTAAQSKWVISHLDCLVAARMHATIASFSSYVPTVSLAYSVKTTGINEMVFGHSDYVVDLRASPLGIVVELVGRVLREEKAIRAHLVQRMTAIKSLSMTAGAKLREILQ